MKIGNSADQAELASAALRAASDGSKAKAAGDTKAAAAAVVAGSESTKVELSSAVSSLAGATGSESVFDAEKVARMQEAIANGTYVISPEGIASKLIANAKEVLANAHTSDTNG